MQPRRSRSTTSAPPEDMQPLLSLDEAADDGEKKRSPAFFLVLLCTIALVNYVDRGALNATMTNLQDDLCLTTANAGFVPSAFVAGYIAAAPYFAHLSSSYVGRSFRLMGFGLACFSVGSLLSYFSVEAKWYVPLLLSRALVGVGEAAFLVLAPPFIDRIAGPDNSALWLAMFYATIPFGMAVGFGVGGQLGQWGAHAGESHYALLFLLDGLLMVPFIVVALAAPASWEPPATAESDKGHKVYGGTEEKWWEGPRQLLAQPIYICLTMGYGASFVHTRFFLRCLCD